jgi:hypothetical protein
MMRMKKIEESVEVQEASQLQVYLILSQSQRMRYVTRFSLRVNPKTRSHCACIAPHISPFPS